MPTTFSPPHRRGACDQKPHKERELDMNAETVKSLEAEKAFWSNPANSSHFSREYWEEELSRDDLDFSLFDGKVVCEIGSGPFGMIHFATDAKQRVAVDPLISFYRETGLLSDSDDGDLRLVEAGGEEIPAVADDSVDVVVCYNVLDHVRDPARVMDEAHRMLRPDGLLYLNCHIVRPLFSPIRKALGRIDPPHPYHFSKSDLAGLLRASGFHPTRERLYPMAPPVESAKLAAARLAMQHYAVLATARG
jgi:SAM-dependent methyltransferase